MALADLWTSARHQLEGKHVQQVIAFAGSGRLADGNEASQEFRALLQLLPPDLLARYVDECLSGKFDNSGLALQDVVNEVGRRLGFKVTNGRYRGQAGIVGNDGLWCAPEGFRMVVEVKTTDAYRLDLNTLANYRLMLASEGRLALESSSVLLVVGREDTGDLEAQIRGSRHASDIRLISADALLHLMQLCTNAESPPVATKVREILVPHDFTRLDAIIDLVFSASEDVRQPELIEESALRQPTASAPPIPLVPSPFSRTARTKRQSARLIGERLPPVSFYADCVTRLEQHFGRPLVKRSRSLYGSADRRLAVVCSISKEHEVGGRPQYWFGFHPYQRDALREASEAQVAFGCGSAQLLFVIPLSDLEAWLPRLNVTTRENGAFYWHVVIREVGNESRLIARQGEALVDLRAYRI